jgi:hypothetical protein
MKPRKHADIMKAFADGADIEWKMPHQTTWDEVAVPTWKEGYEYRVKSKPEPKPDWKKYVRIETHKSYICSWEEDLHNPNLRLTFDGETNKLKSAEVL